MSAYENFRRSVERNEDLGKTFMNQSVKAGRNLLNEIDNRMKAMQKLQDALKDMPLKVGDVVHEEGFPEEKGDVLRVEQNEHEASYHVRIRHRRKVVLYYREELVFMERVENG